MVMSALFLFGGLEIYMLGGEAQEIGLAFFGVAIDGFITACVYVSDWFQDLDESMRIITFVWVAPFVGMFVGLDLDGLPGATLALAIAVLAAQAVAVPVSVYLYLRDKREYREYEEEMRRWGKEP
jgi:hypothetical protein